MIDMNILTFSNVNKGFGEGDKRAEILKDINLEVAEGEFVAILGFSGTGKSTLMNLIAGLEVPDTGHITFKGEKEMTFTLFEKNSDGKYPALSSTTPFPFVLDDYSGKNILSSVETLLGIKKESKTHQEE